MGAPSGLFIRLSSVHVLMKQHQSTPTGTPFFHLPSFIKCTHTHSLFSLLLNLTCMKTLLVFVHTSSSSLSNYKKNREQNWTYMFIFWTACWSSCGMTDLSDLSMIFYLPWCSYPVKTCGKKKINMSIMNHFYTRLSSMSNNWLSDVRVCLPMPVKCCVWGQFPVAGTIMFSLLVNCTTVHLEEDQELCFQVVRIQTDWRF